MGRGLLGIVCALLAGGLTESRCPRGSRALELSGRCDARLVLVNDSVGDEAESLPVIAELEDVAPSVHRENLLGCGAEYGGEDRHRAKLGPLDARYTSIDYKGQSITSNTTLSLSSPTCPEAVVDFVMAGPTFVRLRRDPARDVYVVTGGILQNKAIAVRMTPATK